MIYLTEAERRIMEILWEKSPRTLEEISELVSSENHWTVHAIQILLKRLIQGKKTYWGSQNTHREKAFRKPPSFHRKKHGPDSLAMKRPC